jgi:Gram-negative bacterial TonB protein C-terminal
MVAVLLHVRRGMPDLVLPQAPHTYSSYRLANILFRSMLLAVTYTLLSCSRIPIVEEDVETTIIDQTTISCNLPSFIEEDSTELRQAPEKVYELIDIHKTPMFPGGERAMLKYLAENIKYPKECCVQGKVAVSFVINEDGSISDVILLKDLGCGTGQEAVRVVKNMPRWRPGEINGEVEKTLMVLPVRIRSE